MTSPAPSPATAPRSRTPHVVRSLVRATLASIVLVPLALAASTGSHAASGQRFDDSRAFDRQYASRFFTTRPMTPFLVGAVFAQTRSVENFNRRGSAVDPNNVVVDDVCGCSYDRRGQLVDPSHCSAMSGVRDEGLAHMSTFSIIDPRDLARPLACFKDGSKACVDEGGAVLGGLSCCTRVDKDFVGATRDPHFVMLAPAPLADRLRGLVPGRADPASPEVCGFKVDAAAGVFSLPRRFDGIIARTMLYASRRYGTLAPVPADVLVALSNSSPASTFEIARERMARLTYQSSDRALDAALRASPVPLAFRQLGASQ